MSNLSLARLLDRLLKDGSLPESSISQGNRIQIQRLIEAGALEQSRINAGRRLEVKNRAVLEAFVTANFPQGMEKALKTPGSRADAVAVLRDSKKSPQNVPEGVLLRGFGESCLLIPLLNAMLPVAQLTRLAGAAALRIDDGCQWSFSGKIAIVENGELFFNIEKIDVSIDIVVYSSGRLSNRLIAWLASKPMAGCSILHFGDYDPVGLDEFRRLKEACPRRVSLYLPESLEQLFARYGKPELLQKSPEVLARLRKEADPVIQSVVQLMDHFGAGLEQEILLTPGITISSD